MTVELTRDHLAALATAAAEAVHAAGTVHGWGIQLATVLDGGGRLLACGNGGSAAEAQHLTGELVGRFRHDRRPYAGDRPAHRHLRRHGDRQRLRSGRALRPAGAGPRPPR